MICLYRILFLPALVLSLPYYLRRILRRGGYAKTLKHRFGYMGELPRPQASKTRIWIQAVSVGEVEAAGALIKRLAQDTSLELILTTTTSTGYALAQKSYAQYGVIVRGFPLDFWPFSRRAWKKIQPGMIVLMESELWPEHLHQAHRRNTPALLVNARLSDRSFSRCRRLTYIIRPLMLKRLSRVLAASEQDRQRFLQLGATPNKLSVSGNIKFDVTSGHQLSAEEQAALRKKCGFVTQSGEATPPFVLLGASTWPGEEVALIETLTQAVALGIDCRLLLVPRHAERRDELEAILQEQDHPFHFRSWEPTPSAPLIYVADTTGELKKFLAIADLVFIGKSLPPHQGGQTPIDAAALGKPMLFGPNMSNFKAISTALLQGRGALEVQDTKQLQAAVLRLINDNAEREALGRAAQDWHTTQRGAADKTVDAIYGAISRLNQ